MNVLYGIGSCDTVRRARRWLSDRSIDYEYRDLRTDCRDRLTTWLAVAGSAAVLNRRSTTWRQLSEAERAKAAGDEIIDLLRQYPTLIKRPVLEMDSVVYFGFDEKTYAGLYPDGENQG